jgi:type I restriction enzyme, S subunit
MSDKLPQGWAETTVGRLFASHGGGTPNRGTAAYWKGDIPWLSSGDIKATCISESSETITKRGLEESAARLCRRGSVLVVMRSGILKHTLPVAMLEREAAINQDIKAFDSGDDRLNAWLALAWRASARNLLAENREGTTVQSVKMETLRDFVLPVPPLAEQQRIVVKLQKLLGQVDTCRQRLAKVPALLKRFRQSVLAAACSGRLTADWREENPNVEDAAVVIMNAQFQIGEREEELPDLPEKWKWVALGNYARCFRGRFSPRPRNDPRYFNGEHPFIQIGNLPREGGLVSSHVQTLNDEGLAVSRKFPKGTVVIAIVGATIGNTGVLAYDMCVTDSIVGLETGDKFGNRYVELFLRHKKDDIRQISYSSGGQPNINLAALNPYPLALPPLPEQQEIVRRVEGLFGLADQIEARYAKARAQVDKLTPSLLARAFRGQLVPQDPNDEPASALLERIEQSRK